MKEKKVSNYYPSPTIEVVEVGVEYGFAGTVGNNPVEEVDLDGWN